MRIKDIYSAGIHGINQVSRFLTKTHHRKQQQKRQPDLSLRYAGSWSFTDPQTKQKHEMAIGRDFTIKIDQKELPGRIIGLDGEQLVFLDHYGFQLKVFANHLGPIEIYDESSDQTYPVINHRDQPRLPKGTDVPVDEADHDLVFELDDLALDQDTADTTVTEQQTADSAATTNLDQIADQTDQTSNLDEADAAKTGTND
ncbi:DUF4828 domain-containing protein [Lapidilactobacillus gannanensis]|uniref:DUF4828 domain-containing protein n=1 Tax=Lapidilactobacillus gannanensis TaxID=2486002 RepID=A0ABW4BNM1_9LACO|nr:DUF4828 domain-containing protein [Lapidilactobacillus gannanensis]